MTRKLTRPFGSIRLRASAGFLALVAMFAQHAPITGDEPPATLPDPFSIRRILVSSDRLSTEPERFGKGVRMRLPRTEFEERVQQAARASQLLSNPPRLVQATYRASLIGNDLVGAGEWHILNPTSAPGLLSLQSLSLALQKTRIQNGASPATDAVVGLIEGTDCGLLVEKPGESTVWFDWSAHGDFDGRDQRFSLKTPSAAAASLELDMPAHCMLSVGCDGCLTSGPHPSSSVDRRRWRLEFPGRDVVEFAIRPSPLLRQSPPPIIAALQARHDVHADFVESTFEFKLEVATPGVQELTFDLDSVLRPFDVDISNGTVVWTAKRDDSDGRSPKVHVALSEPFRSGTITIRCLTPIAADQRWNCPECCLSGSVAQNEALHIRVADGVQLDEWDNGDFGFIPTGDEESGWQVMTLTRRNFVENGSPRRPRAIIRGRHIDVRAELFAWCHVGPGTATATVQIHYEFINGRVSLLPLQFGPGWEVESVTATPTGSEVKWHLVASSGKEVLSVELSDSMTATPTTNPVLTMRLRSKESWNSRSKYVIAFPSLTPIAAHLRKAVFGVLTAPNINIEVQTAATATSPLAFGPWGRSMRGQVFMTRGGAVDGTIHVHPLAPVVTPAMPPPLKAFPHVAESGEKSPTVTGGSARLFSRLETDGRLLHVYDFEISQWCEKTVSVRLPFDAHSIAARVDGRQAIPLAIRRSESGCSVNLSIPGDGGQHRCELMYSMPMSNWTTWTRLGALAPSHDSSLSSVCHTWFFPTGIAPVWMANYKPDRGSGDPGTSFGSSLGRWLGLDAWFTQRPAVVALPDSPSEMSMWLARGARAWREEYGEVSVASILVMREDLIPPIGVTFALLVLCVARMTRRAPLRSRITIVIAGLIIGILGFLFAPEALQPIWVWPSLAAIVLIVAWCVRTLGESRKSRTLARIAAAPAITLAVVGALTGQIVDRSDATVLIVPSTTEKVADQSVLVEPSLLDRLDRMARRATTPVPSPMITSAKYDGTINGQVADIRAHFHIFHPVADKMPFVLPLAGVQLKEVLLDGAPVALAHRPALVPKLPEHYVVDIAGRGVHQLSLVFTAPITEREETSELRFLVPPVLQSDLAIDFSPGCRCPHALEHQGACTVNGEEPILNAAPTGPRLEAHLGSVNKVHLRWYSEVLLKKPPEIRVREAYLWTLHPETAMLAALLQYSIKSGAITTLDVQLPKSLEIRTLGVERLPGGNPDEPRPLLRDWSVSTAGEKRMLTVHFQRPVTNGVQIMFHGLPRQPLGHRCTLPIPEPRAASADSDVYLVYRAGGVTAQLGSEPSGIASADRKAFLDTWTAARMPGPGPEVHVYRFRRTTESPVLPLVLDPIPNRSHAAEQVRWSIGSQRSELQISTTIDAPDGDLCFLEWEISPKVVIDEVSGRGVRSWSRFDDRLQVWLRRTADSTEVTIVGTIMNETAAEFRLPLVRLASVPNVTSNVRLDVPIGRQITPAELSGLWAAPSSQVTPGTADYLTDRPDYSGRFTIRPADR